MASSSAVDDRQPARLRALTTESCSSTSTSTSSLRSNVTPAESIRTISSSCTELSSLAEGARPDGFDDHNSDDDNCCARTTNDSNDNRLLRSTHLIDTYGNPFDIPDFTMKQIHDAIPAHCFKRSGLRGLGYVARDLACIAATFYLADRLVTPEAVPSRAIRAGLWVVYSFVQGLFGTGLWILAHECGHQSFSPSRALNDTVGWLCHSALLVPYFSWKITHAKHHQATGHLERDMVFVPRTRTEHASRIGRLSHELSEVLEETPLMSIGALLVQQLMGWMGYLFTNVTGHNCHERHFEGKGRGKANGLFGGVNHFLPSSPLFERKDEHLILLSDLGLALAAAVLISIGRTYGWANLLVWYFAPYLWVNHWLVAITFLQHTDPQLPHYEPHMWTFTRGAAATIDRDFGFIGRTLMHGIIDTHVLHHLASRLPFYHATEATEAIRRVMGRHYRSDTRGGSLGFLYALWRSERWCRWIEPCAAAEGDERGVLFFRNPNGLGVPPACIEEVSPSN